MPRPPASRRPDRGSSRVEPPARQPTADRTGEPGPGPSRPSTSTRGPNLEPPTSPRGAKREPSTHARGQEGEQLAEVFLRELGYVIVARNARTPTGEIDRIALDGHTLCFVEVRLRSGLGYGSAEESVDARKQRRLLRAARAWLALGIAPAHAAVRFDVVAIDARSRPPRIELYRDAFGEAPPMR